MKRIFLMLCALLAGCSGHTRQRQGLTIEQGVLSVGVEIGYPPMEYFDTDSKTPIGFDIELAKALGDRLGLNVKYVDTAWDGILVGVQTARYDLAVNVTILPERQKTLNFTKPYISNAMAIVLHKDSAVKIENPEDIAGYSAAYQTDTTAQYFIERLRRQGIQCIPFAYDKIVNCFDDLGLRRVDFVAADSLTARYYTGKENSPFVIGWQGPADEMIGICLKKENDALTNALDKALEELFANGTMVQISRRFFNQDMVSSVRPAR